MPANVQRSALRINYEDTDFSGRVYHASYLRFFDRGRTQWRRFFSSQYKQLVYSGGLRFAVTNPRVDFLAPATIESS